ncbi:hypothetical protein PC123_g19736 [Phytophthora cactorum]|nr:hypothetical protein PC123_g19736 [Phytophthora cactorum]
MATFKSKYDIQVLLGGEAVTDRIYYCCKYVTKPQNEVDSPAAIALAALNRRKERESLEPSDDNSQISRKCVASLAYNLTNRQEVAGPLAALYLLRESCCYSSATCVNLPLDSMLKQLMCKDPYPCNLIVTETSGITDDQVQEASAFDDYIFRPLKLEALSVYEFWMKFFRAKRGESTRDDSCFLSGYPLFSNHRVGSRRKQIVPSISGPRMPLVDENTPIDVRAKRSRIALVLFKPFRSVEDLQGGDKFSDDDWNAAYADWEPRLTSFTRTIIGNINDYFKGRSSKPKEVEGTISDSDEENNSEADSIERETDEQMDPFADTTSMNGDSPDDNESERGEIEMLETDQLDPVHFPSSPKSNDHVKGILNTFSDLGMLTARATHMVSHLEPEPHQFDTNQCTSRSESNPFQLEDLQKWVHNRDTDNYVNERMLMSKAPKW